MIQHDKLKESGTVIANEHLDDIEQIKMDDLKK